MVLDALPVEQPPDETSRLVQAVQALAEARPELDAEGLVLAGEPAAAETQHGTAAGQVVEGGRELGGQARRPERVGPHQQAQADRPGQPGQRRQRGPALELGVVRVTLVGEQVVVDPDRVPAGALGGQGGLAQVRPRASVDPERRSEAHLAIVRGRACPDRPVPASGTAMRYRDERFERFA